MRRIEAKPKGNEMCKKRIMVPVLVLMVGLVGLCGSAATTYTKEIDGSTWSYTLSVSSDKTITNATITAVTPADGALVVPSVVDGYPVTAIGQGAFDGCTSLNGISFPATLTTINENAFRGCSSLDGVVLPLSLTSIGPRAFQGCTSLKSIALPDSLVTMGKWVFEFCTGLTNVVFGSGVTVVPYRTFNGCNRLSSVTLKEGVEEIGEDVFQGCSALTSITFPLSMRKVWANAFKGLSNLENVSFNEGLEIIEENAFKDCTALNGITLPSSLKSIGPRAFQCCNGLKSVIIPDSVTSMGKWVFEFCTGLTNVVFGSGVAVVPNRTFNGCNRLSSVTLKEGVEEIGEDVFQGCSALTSITFPLSMRKVWANAFSGLSNLQSVTFNEGLVEIGTGAFDGCTSLNGISLPTTLTTLNENAFRGCAALDGVVLPSSLKAIGARAFQSCTSLKAIEVPDSVTTMGNWVFEFCTGLTNAVFGSGVAAVPYRTFYGCSRLSSVTLREGVEVVGEDVFQGCSALKSISFPSSMRKVWTNAFKDLTNLETVSFNEGLETIEDNAFAGCSSLTGIVFPSTLKTIGTRAFQSCISLSSIVLPDSVTTLGQYAFEWCNSLRRAEIGDGVYELPYGLFNSCPVLGSVKLGRNVDTIYGYAFGGCKCLRYVEFLSDSCDKVADTAFRNVKSAMVVYVPDGATGFGETWQGFVVKPASEITADADAPWDLMFYLKAGWPSEFFLSDTEKSTVACTRFLAGNPIYSTYGSFDAWSDVAIDCNTNTFHLSGSAEIWSEGWTNGQHAVNCAMASESKLPTNLQNLVPGEYTVTVVLNEPRTFPETNYSNNSNSVSFVVVPSTAVSFMSEENEVGFRRYATGEPYGSLPTPEKRIGYEFAGWFADENLVSAVLVTNIVPEKDTSLYARWEVRPQHTNYVSGAISASATWKSGDVYVATDNLTIANGATLTIEPGVIVKFATGKSLTVNSGGTLSAIGTRALPIIFTSIKDDANGGDTNGDGDETAPQAGDWTKIGVYGGTATFNYATILYSSRNSMTGAINMDGRYGKVIFENGEIAHCAYDAVGVESGQCHVKNTIIHDCLLAFRHWTKEPIVNCVIYDCGRLTQGGGQKFYNCIFSHITETWEAFSFPNNGTTYRNCCFWNEGGSILHRQATSSENWGAQDAKSVCGKNGNIWANPLFIDPDRGDFRIAANSPCIDAGDGTVAPELDYYGLERRDVKLVTDSGVPNAAGVCPDIGIHEVLWDDDDSPYDIAPSAVAADKTSVKIGDALKVSWTIQNVGTEDVVGGWHDAVSLVSESGQSVSLGEALTTYTLKRKNSINVNATFVVPVLSEGKWYARVTANSHRSDIPEGRNTTNNVLTSESPITVALAATPYADGAKGTLSASGSTVVKFTFPAGTTGQIARVSVPAGLSVSYGLGFMPQGTYASGTMTATEKGKAVFHVPAGTTEVYLVMDAAQSDGQSYSVSFENGDLAILSVSPNTVPSSGTVTITINGAGFDENTSVSFVAGSSAVVAQNVRCVSSEQLTATFDGSAWTGGSSVSIRLNGGAAEFPNAFTVKSTQGAARFWAKLVVPESMRRGRLYRGYVEYGNSGNADMTSPVLQVSIAGDGTLGYVGYPSNLDMVQFVAAGDRGCAGVLRPGSVHRYEFSILAGQSNKISLRSSEGSDYAPLPWTDMTDYMSCLSEAAMRIDLRGDDPTDYEEVLSFATEVKSEDDVSTIHGRILSVNGTCVSGVFVTAESITSTNVFCAKSNNDGRFVIKSLPPDNYLVGIFGGGYLPSKVEVVVKGNTDSHLDFTIDNKISAMIYVDGNTSDVIVTAHSIEGGEAILATEDCGKYVFYGLSNGIYRVEANAGDMIGVCRIQVMDEDYALGYIKLGEYCSVSGVVPGFQKDDVPFVIAYSDKGTYMLPISNDGTFLCSTVLPGMYKFVHVSSVEPLNDGDVIEILSGEHVQVEVQRNGSGMKSRLAYSKSNSSSSNKKLGNADEFDDIKWYQTARGVAFDLVMEGLALQKESFYNLPRKPIGEYDCKENVSKYKSDILAFDAFTRELTGFKIAYDRSDTILLWIASFSRTVGYGADVYKSLYLKAQKEIAVTKLNKFNTALTELLFSTIETIDDEIVMELKGAASDGIDVIDELSVVTDVGKTGALLAKVNNYAKKIESGCKRLRDSKYTKELSELGDVLDAASELIQLYEGLTVGAEIGRTLAQEQFSAEDLRKKIPRFRKLLAEQRKIIASYNDYSKCCTQCCEPNLYEPPIDEKRPNIPQSCDPNEMVGPEGTGEARYVQPGEWMTYTIYFENKTNATAAAQEVFVTNPLSEWLDWSTFEMGEVSFGNQVDFGLSGLNGGASEVQMNGTNFNVRTTLALERDEERRVGDNAPYQAKWYLRIVDNSDETTWPADPYAGFLPPNDPDTHCGEGHLTYRIKVRDDAPRNVVITNSATIVFDYNAPIETDPFWWNTIGTFHDVSIEVDGVTTNLTLIVGEPFGILPTPTEKRTGYAFDAWYTGPNGTGTKATPDALVPAGDFTLYANWIGNPYKVRFNANGGTGTMLDQAFVYGTAQRLYANAFTCKMYSFAGWALSANGEAVFTDGQEVENLTSVANDVVTLYAVWTMERPLLWTEVTGSTSAMAATVYDGYLYDGDGNVKGTILVKVGKPNKKTGLAAVKATVVGLDGKKKTLKAAEKGKAQIAADGPTTVSLVGGEACEVVLGAKGMAGTYGSFTIDGALSVFASKDAADKAVASGVLAKWQGVVNVAWRLAGDGSPYQTLSVTIANKGKAKVSGTLANGTKVSAKGQLIVGESWCCVPVVYAKKGARLAFGVWLPRNVNGQDVRSPSATGGTPVVPVNGQDVRSPSVVGLGEAIVGKPGTLKAGAEFELGGAMGDAKYEAYLPNGVAVGGGAKWTLPKAGKVQFAKDGTVDESKLGENPSALKLTYKAKDGSFKGSFKVYADVGGKPKATTVKVMGVLVGGVGYGAATVKGGGGVPVRVE